MVDPSDPVFNVRGDYSDIYSIELILGYRTHQNFENLEMVGNSITKIIEISHIVVVKV